jgi:hypothetical protein
MLCHQLIHIVRSSRLLEQGSFFTEPHRADLHDWEHDRILNGKEASLCDYARGGNGYPECHFQTHSARAAFDAGCTIERRDLRSFKVWSASLAECQRDRSRGQVS